MDIYWIISGLGVLRFIRKFLKPLRRIRNFPRKKIHNFSHLNLYFLHLTRIYVPEFGLDIYR
jgi:hypothetical protein